VLAAIESFAGYAAICEPDPETASDRRALLQFFGEIEEATAALRAELARQDSKQKE
jgi:hypothetical protein